MTRRRGVSLVLALVALLGYGLTHTHTALVASAPKIAQHSAGEQSLIIEPEAGIAPILQMIEHASSSVDLVIYQLQDQTVEDALVADAARGVTVRVLLNLGYYGKKENDKNDVAYQYLSTHGVEVHWAPAYFALTHQKTILIDKKQALIMTMNLTPQYYQSGREFVVVDNDVNDVSAAESAFEDDWNGNKTSASNGDDLIWSPGSENALLSLIAHARTSLDIYNEEMADTKITRALEDAARRGINVRVTMTYSTNWKKAFVELTNAGVQVRTYAKSAPLYIHAKVIISDGTRAFIGSENFSSNSLNKNRELGLIATDPALLTSLQATFEKDWTGARDFTPSS